MHQIIKIKVYEEKYVKFLIEYLTLGEFIYETIEIALATMTFPILANWKFHTYNIRKILELADDLECRIAFINEDEDDSGCDSLSSD